MMEKGRKQWSENFMQEFRTTQNWSKQGKFNRMAESPVEDVEKDVKKRVKKKRVTKKRQSRQNKKQMKLVKSRREQTWTIHRSSLNRKKKERRSMKMLAQKDRQKPGERGRERKGKGRNEKWISEMTSSFQTHMTWEGSESVLCNMWSRHACTVYTQGQEATNTDEDCRDNTDWKQG